MTAHAAIAAVPKTGEPNRTLLQALLVSRIAYVIGDTEDPTQFDPRGEGAGPLTLVIGYGGSWFWYDEADGATGHDGTTCILTAATGGRYKVTGVDLLITHVISKTLTTPPDPDDVDEGERPSNGDAYLVPAASSGGWATKPDYIAVWVAARREWFYIAPKPGWFVWVPGSTQDIAYHYDSVQAEWISGLGGGAVPADTVALSSIIGVAASLTIRVENQTIYAPPGSRKTGATPSMPFGGTASNINDNSDSTSATTGIIGVTTGLTVTQRVVARLALAAATDLIAIETRGMLVSSGAGGGVGLYYSTDNGTNWTLAGTTFTPTTSGQTFLMTGTFNGVTDVALVASSGNYGTVTMTLAGLNAFGTGVTASVGDSYIIAANAFGIFAGHAGKVAVCEVADTFAIYTPQIGDTVFDKALAISVRWNGTSWASTAGALVAAPYVFTSSGSTTLVDSFGSIYAYSATTPPTTSHARRIDDVTIPYAAPNASVTLEVEYEAVVSGWGLGAPIGGSYTSVDTPAIIALFRDSESNAIAWFPCNQVRDTNTWENPDMVRGRFRVAVPNASEHTYKIAIIGGGYNDGSADRVWECGTLSRRYFSIKALL